MVKEAAVEQSDISGPISDFLELYDKKSTRSMYRAAIVSFLAHVYKVDHPSPKPLSGTVSTYLQAFNDMGAQYLTEQRKYGYDILSYISHLKSKGTPPKTIKTYGSIVRAWLKVNDIEVSVGQEKMIGMKMKRSAALTKDMNLNRDLIRRLLQHSPLELRTVIMVLLSSGMRINECLKLLLADVDLEHDPVKITLRPEICKNGEGRITFISTEAAKLLREWLAYRPAYLQKREAIFRENAAKLKNLDTVVEFQNDKRLFPFTEKVVRKQLDPVLEKVFTEIPRDEHTNRRTVNFHGFRRYFRSTLVKGGNGNSTDIVERLMGHAGYLSSSYVRISDEEMARFYRDAEHVLWIETPVQVNTEELKTIQSENQQLKARLSEMDEQLTAIKAQEDKRNAFIDYLMQRPDFSELLANVQNGKQ